MFRTGNTIIVPTTGGWQAHDVSGVLPPVVEYPPVATGRLWLNTDYSAQDWGRDSLFLDVMRTARAWRAQTSGQYDDAAKRAEMMATADSDGYPTVLPADTAAGTIVMLEQGAASAPALGGRYRLEYQGAGTLLLGGVSNQTSGAGFVEFDFTPTDSNSIDIRITATAAGNHIRGMKCYLVAHAALVAAGQVVHPAFKAAYPNIKTLRWMMAQDINANLQTTWATVPQPTSVGKGISWLEMVKANNELGCDGWFHFPAGSDANHVTQGSIIVRDNLNPALKAYFEYGNEPWNNQWDFRTYHYLNALAAQTGLTVYEMWGGRSTETMQAVSAVFAGQMHRIVRVMGVQTGYTGLTEQFWNAAGWVAAVPGRVAPGTVHDALAVTGYFNCEYSQWPAVIAAAQTDYATGRTLLLSKIQDEIDAHLNTFWPYFKTFADARGKQLLMYEGGSHLYNPGGHGNDTLANQLVAEVNRGDLIVDKYAQMMNNWSLFSSVPGGFNQFSATRRPTATGEFGARQTINVATPRSAAIMGYNAGTFPAAAPAVGELPLNQRLVISGHSIPDATARDPLAAAITAMGGTAQKWTATGPHSSAQWRWDNPVAVGTPDNVKALMQAGGASYDAFIGTEAHGGSYTHGADPVGRASVLANTTQYSPPAQSGANVYALLWHNLAASTGAQTYYLNFWRNDPALLFGSAWRAAQEPEKPLWTSILTYVNANKAAGTSDMRMVPLLEVFCAVYDGIQAGTVTGITMASLFADDVHIDTAVGRWVQLATIMAVVYHRHPDQLPANAGPLANISPALAAQLRTIIWATCLADQRTGLAA